MFKWYRITYLQKNYQTKEPNYSGDQVINKKNGDKR